jgi:hypothetical protein
VATFAPVDVLDEVRVAVQDALVPYRNSDASLLRIVNHRLKSIAILRPDLFAAQTSFECASGARQSAPSDCIRMFDVLECEGRAVGEVDEHALGLAKSAWLSAPPGPATDWMRNTRNPGSFFVFPPAPPGQILTIEYARAPRGYRFDERIDDLSDAYFPVVVDCVVWWIESMDDEAVKDSRAQMFQQTWMSALKTSLEARVITDTPRAGDDVKKVI